MIDTWFSGMPWILGALGAYRAALPMAHKLPPGRIKDAIVSILGAGGPGAVPR